MQICRRWKRWRSISSEHRLQRDKGWKKTFVDRNEFGLFECRWLSMTFRFSPRDLRLFLSFLVWRSGKALEDVHRHILQSFIKRLCYEHTCRTTHMWSFKQRCPHRYELIDFPCSFRSLVLKLIFFPHSLCLAFLWTTRRDLHENFLIFIKPKTKKKNVRKVIRLTTLSTNNSELTKIYFLPFVKQSRERTKTISLSLSGNKSSARGKIFARYLMFHETIEESWAKSVCTAPSIHHAISRQKLSINHSARQSNDEMR